MKRLIFLLAVFIFESSANAAAPSCPAPDSVFFDRTELMVHGPKNIGAREEIQVTLTAGDFRTMVKFKNGSESYQTAIPAFTTQNQENVKLEIIIKKRKGQDGPFIAHSVQSPLEVSEVCNDGLIEVVIDELISQKKS